MSALPVQGGAIRLITRFGRAEFGFRVPAPVRRRERNRLLRTAVLPYARTAYSRKNILPGLI